MIEAICVFVGTVIGITIGVFIEKARICSIMQKFFEIEEYKMDSYSKNFCKGIFYLNDYIEKYY